MKTYVYDVHLLHKTRGWGNETLAQILLTWNTLSFKAHTVAVWRNV